MIEESLESLLMDVAARVTDEISSAREIEESFSSLPAGLFAARRVRLVPAAPSSSRRLSAQSRWFFEGHDLFVEVSDDLESHLRLLESLLRYRRVAEIARRGGLEALPEAIGVDASELSEPTRQEIESMVASAIDLDLGIEVSAHLASQWAAAGEAEERLLAETNGEASIHLVVLDDPIGLELLSPYARDLGPSIYRWAREHPEQVPASVTERAIRSGRFDADVITAIALRLLGEHPELLLEKRQAERSVGMRIEHVEGLRFGLVDLERLRGSDPCVHEDEDPRSGELMIMAGPNLELAFLLAARFARARRFVSGTVVMRREDAPEGVHLAGLEMTGARAWTDRLRRRADEIDLNVGSIAFDPVADRSMIRLLQLTQRAEPRPGAGDAPPILAVVYGVDPHGEAGLRAILDAARLGLSVLCRLVCPPFLS